MKYSNSQFLEDAQHILDNSELLSKSYCRIIDGRLYEQLDEYAFAYRVFFSVDDYDYVEDVELLKELDHYFNKV